MIASIIWLVCIAAAFAAAVLRNIDAAALVPYAATASAPALLTLVTWPLIRREGTQILIILSWLSLAIMACLSIGFIPMAFMFMCAPAAAAMFEKEKVIEAMFLAVVSAFVIYYLGVRDFIPAETIASTLQSDWGKPVGIVGTFAFLTAALYGAADSARYKLVDKGYGESGAILDAVPGGIIRVTAENNISFATDAAHQLFGLPADMGVLSVSRIFSDINEQTALLSLIGRARRSHAAESRRFTVRDAGHSVHAEITASPLDNDNVLLYVADTSAHEERINALQAARVGAEQATEGKALFFAGVSHELRTPLNAIIGFSDMMRSRLFGPLPGKYAEYADLIHDSGQHMLDLIGDVLDMTKVEAGKYELTYSMFDAADVIRSSIKMIRPTADAAEVQIDADIIEQPVELLIEADRKAVRQILLNLLSNAIKFSHRGGLVTVSTKTVGNVLNMTVTDNGVGISERDLVNIGKPFSQSASGKANEERSSGLGLSLVKSLSELHNGRFVIASQEGEGTTVDIYLPLNRRKDDLD